MRIVEDLKTGIDLTKPRLDLKWMILFILFAALIFGLIWAAKWIVARVSALPGLSAIAPTEQTNSASATAPGWDY